MMKIIQKCEAFSNPGTLEDYKAHIWAVDLDQYEYLEYGDQLPPSERARASRFHFDIHRNRFIKKHVILRFFLGNYLGKDFYGEEFAYGSKGKPYLSEKYKSGNIYFNISHSEGLALYGFTRYHEIGVDIEFVRDIPEMDKIARQFFSTEENDVFHSLPDSTKKEAFFNCWTRKEAFIKAIGDGLYQGLENFDLALKPGELAKLLRIGGNSKKASKWLIQDFKPACGFIGAFAVEEGNWEVHYWKSSDLL